MTGRGLVIVHVVAFVNYSHAPIDNNGGRSRKPNITLSMIIDDMIHPDNPKMAAIGYYDS